MEESHPPATAESPQSGEMSQQKLMQKCKNLLTIAQKAKTARDEALQERAKLEEELEKAKETIIQKDQQAKNFQEIMGVLTDQKLKLAMDIDTLKKEKTTFAEQLRAVNKEKGDLIDKLQVIKQSESQLLNDIKKLQVNNERVTVLCTNVTQEKLQMEQELRETTAHIELWNRTLADKMGIDRVELKDLVSLIDRFSGHSPDVETKEQRDADEVSLLLAASQKENETLLQQVTAMKDEIQRLNVDRDQMANNLDGMTIEINKLFENAEQLNKEVELAREAEAILKQEIRDLKKKSSDEGAVVVGSSVLSILKEGIVSNLVDLADTMPEYSKEFLEKLNAMLQGTDLRGDEGANIFVHYFNECLSQLKISLKENDILSKEVDHLNNSVKEHETLVANHNKDCERLRTELEELSSDSRQLLLDLSHLRHENSMRVTEIEDLMVRLRSKDEKCDKLEEDRRRESDSAEMKIRSLQKELEEAHAGMAKKTQEYEELKVRLHEMESSRKYLNDTRQVTSKLEHENEDLLKMLAEKEELLSGFEELKANDAGKLSEELHSAREELISKTAQLKDSQAAIDALKDELNALRSKYHDKQCQRDAETQVDTETSVQENIERLQQELDKMSEELSKTKRQLEESRTVKKDVKDLGKALKQQNSELEKAQRVLQEKANIEDELSHLKASHLKTMEELKNTNQRLEQSQQASKNLSEVEASLKNKSSELEKALWLLEERSAEKLAVSEELDKVKEELKSTVQQLQLSRSEGESVKRDADEMHVTLEGVSKELDAARQDLRRKVDLEEEVVRIQEALNESVKQMEKSQRENVLVNDKAQKLNLELESAASELKSAREKLLDVGKLAAEFEALKLQFVEIAEELQKAQELVEEGHAAKVEAEKLAVELDRVTQELERVRVELQNKESLEIEASALRKRLEEVTNDCQELKKLADVSGTAQTDAQKLASEVERLSEEVRSAKNELEQKAELQRELGAANNQLQKTFDELSSLKKLIEDGDAIKSSLEKAVEEGAAVTESLRHENARFLETTERLQAENEVLSDKLSNQACAFNDELIKKNEEIRTLSSKIEEFQEMANFRKMELEDINCIWAGRLNSFKAILITLGRSLNELSLQSKELQQMFLEKLRSLNTVLTVNTKIVVDQAKNELLDEMHRMNKHLKDRGEAIEKLKNTLSETEGKLESVTTQHNELVNVNNKMMADLKTKDDKLVANETALKELETEVGRLRELKEGPPESDVLSTSTISRSEDHMRLKEVDDSIEEKYIKLRQIAVKLKKRVAELTQALDQSKSGADKDLHEKIQHLSAVAKNAQKVQESYDKTLDELEECRKQNASLETTVKELRTANETLTSQVTALQSQCANVPMMQKQIEGLNATLKELKVEMNKLDMEKKVEVMKYKESKKQCTILEAEVGSLSQSLDQAVQQGRSHNVLELEMKNYEKVIADLTSQLNTEKQKLANSEKEFASVSLVKSGLEEQISLLDKQVKAEESRNVNVQDQLKSLKEKMSANQRQLDEVNSLLSEAKRELHHAKSLNEEQTLKMSSLTSEFSRKELDLLSRIDSFSAHIQSLEMSLATTKQELTTSNSEKEHLREEFENYRLRAQSMLARQKGDTISHGEKEARENLDKLKKELDGARQKMENTQTEIETLNNKLSSLQLEKARSDKRYEDVTKALHQKITDYDTLNTEYRAFKFSAETLLQNTKLEFEERGRLLNEEITRLKDLVDALNEEALRKSQMADEVRIDNAVEGHHLSDNIPSLLEREDGEGSESVLPPTGNFRRLSNLVPLDILLNNPIDDENRIPVLQEQIEKLHSELNSYDVRVKHLASLLSEAEKDSARSSQQNAVLKEELRRLERSLQREPHIANSEYLKNVIFKFLILQSGDERTRLVPVLDTILKLSPEETSRLNAVARGDSASWGSYLHSWTGL